MAVIMGETTWENLSMADRWRVALRDPQIKHEPTVRWCSHLEDPELISSDRVGLDLEELDSLPPELLLAAYVAATHIVRLCDHLEDPELISSDRVGLDLEEINSLSPGLLLVARVAATYNMSCE